MNYYIYNNNIIISKYEYSNLEAISEGYAETHCDILYVLNRIDPGKSRRSFRITDPELVFINDEGLNLLCKQKNHQNCLPEWIISKINMGMALSVNTCYYNWTECFNFKAALPEIWKINVVGMGDVGSILVTGLRLLGGNNISQIGIYDLDKNKISRMLYESNQIYSSFNGNSYPTVVELEKNELFDCNMFVFCVTAGVPPLGSEKADVRISQYEANSKIINIYAKNARYNNYKGIFAVVSDPVDQLCKSALISSNTDENGCYDLKGLLPEQIHGYGLGVMNARAAYYAGLNENTKHYITEGRAYGPHGRGLIVADSIKNYNHEISIKLTEMAQNANLDVRNTGFKPYIAPALSSGSLSLIDTISGSWHYSSSYLGGVFMGAKNRLTPMGIEIERLDLPDILMERLNKTYESLRDFI